MTAAIHIDAFAVRNLPDWVDGSVSFTFRALRRGAQLVAPECFATVTSDACVVTRAPRGGASASLRQRLRLHPVPDDALVQVTVANAATDGRIAVAAVTLSQQWTSSSAGGPDYDGPVCEFFISFCVRSDAAPSARAARPMSALAATRKAAPFVGLSRPSSAASSAAPGTRAAGGAGEWVTLTLHDAWGIAVDSLHPVLVQPAVTFAKRVRRGTPTRSTVSQTSHALQFNDERISFFRAKNNLTTTLHIALEYQPCAPSVNYGASATAGSVLQTPQQQGLQQSQLVPAISSRSRPPSASIAAPPLERSTTLGTVKFTLRECSEFAANLPGHPRGMVRFSISVSATPPDERPARSVRGAGVLDLDDDDGEQQQQAAALAVTEDVRRFSERSAAVGEAMRGKSFFAPEDPPEAERAEASFVPASAAAEPIVVGGIDITAAIVGAINSAVGEASGRVERAVTRLEQRVNTLERAIAPSTSAVAKTSVVAKFDDADTDGDGAVSLAEACALCRAASPFLSEVPDSGVLGFMRRHGLTPAAETSGRVSRLEFERVALRLVAL